MIRRFAAVVLGLVCLVGTLFFSCRRSPPRRPPVIEPVSVTRRTLARGVELVEAGISRAGSSAGRLVVLYLEPGAVVPDIVINAEARPIADVAPEALIVVNAGFFTPERKPTGLLAAGGRVLSGFVSEGGPAGSGVFVLEGGRMELTPRERVGARTFATATLAIQAGPRIIEADGTPGIRSDDGDHANRTVLGADNLGRMVVAVAIGPAGSASGPTLFETQLLLGKDGLGRHAPELALAFALNLDGGTSTGLVVRAPEAPVRLAEGAAVYSLLTFRRAP